MSRLHFSIECIPERMRQPVRRLLGQPQSNRLAFPGGYGEPVMGGRLGAAQLGVDGVLVAVDNSLDDAVLAVRLLTRLIEGPLRIGVVFGEQQVDLALAVQESLSKET